MLDPSTEGRSFQLRDRVRLNDVDRSGHLRLDAAVRYTQVISNDDTNDAGLTEDLAWIARSTVIDVHQPATVDEALTLVTFCAGLGRTWAQRRVSIVGSDGGHYEVATLWVSIEPETIRPRRLTDEFLGLYGAAANGRRVSAKQRISRPDPSLIADGERLDWTPRWTDIDRFGHMNNVVYWAALQHGMAESISTPTRLLVEHGAGVTPNVRCEVVIDRGSDLRMWWLTAGADGQLSDQYAAAAQVAKL